MLRQQMKLDSKRMQLRRYLRAGSMTVKEYADGGDVLDQRQAKLTMTLIEEYDRVIDALAEENQLLRSLQRNQELVHDLTLSGVMQGAMCIMTAVKDLRDLSDLSAPLPPPPQTTSTSVPPPRPPWR